MSRKENCLDNAPIESFFGLIKDHIDIAACNNLAELEKEIASEINYNNRHRPQVGLQKMPPRKFRRQFEN